MPTCRFVLASPLAAALWLALLDAHAKPVPSPLFGDHAVLQQQKPVPVWGRAEPGEKVTVAFGGVTGTAVADAQGRWRVTLEALPASSVGRELTITGADGVPVGAKDVVVGEVWLASGQSNMAWKVKAAENAVAEQAAANFPAVRQFTVKNVAVLQPAEAVEGSWAVCSPQNVDGFSAVGYFFARDLFQKLGHPVGLLNASWGGTPAEAWTRRAMLTELPELKAEVVRQVTAIERAPADQAAWPELQSAWETHNGVADTENVGFQKGWAAPEFDDQTWNTVKSPFNFQTAGKTKAGGVLWLR
jgi:sialate O-acetylesterase